MGVHIGRHDRDLGRHYLTAGEFRKKYNYALSTRCRHKCCSTCRNHIVTLKVHHWDVGHGNTTKVFEPVLICKACGRGFITYMTSVCDAFEG